MNNIVQITNERLSLLVHEMDEQSSRMEDIMKQEKSKIEHKYVEQIRILKKSNEIDLDLKNNLIEEQQR